MKWKSLLFAGTLPDKVPIAVHVRWQDGTDAFCQLWIFTNKTKAEEFSKTLLPEEVPDFLEAIYILGEGVAPVQSEFEGSVARLLKQMLEDYHPVQEKEFAGLSLCTLCGIWDPPTEGMPGYGLLLWIDTTETGFHVLIGTREQARQTLRNLPWLGARQKHLQKRVDDWNAMERTTSGPLHIEGPVARLLCDASLYFRMEEALDAPGVRMRTRAI